MDRNICYECRHFSFEGGSPGYGPETPGYSGSMTCDKNKWFFDFDSDSQLVFGKCLSKAENCEEFLPVIQGVAIAVT